MRFGLILVLYQGKVLQSCVNSWLAHRGTSSIKSDLFPGLSIQKYVHVQVFIQFHFVLSEDAHVSSFTDYSGTMYIEKSGSTTIVFVTLSYIGIQSFIWIGFILVVYQGKVLQTCVNPLLIHTGTSPVKINLSLRFSIQKYIHVQVFIQFHFVLSERALKRAHLPSTVVQCT